MSSLAPIGASSVTATQATVTATGLPAVDEANAPASIRNGSATVKQAYSSARGFEEMLLQQLSSSLVQSSGLSGEGESSGEGAGEEGSSEGGSQASMLSSLLPQTLTEGVMRAGGLGLAGQLMSSLDPSASATAAPTSAGSSGGGSAPTAAAPTPGASSTGTAAPTSAAVSSAAAARSGGASA
jgi:Rod binding domain-containing protein